MKSQNGAATVCMVFDKAGGHYATRLQHTARVGRIHRTLGRESPADGLSHVHCRNGQQWAEVGVGRPCTGIARDVHLRWLVLLEVVVAKLHAPGDEFHHQQAVGDVPR